MPHDSEHVDEVRGWIAKASSDLEAAGLMIERGFLSHAVFLAQQAAEKSLKAFLTMNSTVFRKTHNIEELAAQSLAIDPGLEPVLRPAVVLTEYAWKFRYPGDDLDPALAESRRAFALAEDVFKAVSSRLPPEFDATKS